MKINAVVVLYNPIEEVINNIETYSHFVNKIFTIDNSTVSNPELIDKLKQRIPNIDYTSLNGNLGIAKALKVGLEKVKQDEATYCLTMDQDSKFPKGKDTDIRKYLERDNRDYGIISLNAIGVDKIGEYTGIKDVDVWISSGNFVIMENYNKIEGFKEELFIDLVDFELCEQFHNINKKIGVIGEISLIHQIGEPIIKRFLWKKVKVDNHPPIRYYYQYRNTEYLWRRNKQFYKRWHKEGYKVELVQFLLGEHKLERLKMIHKGRKDGKKGLLGPYQEEK